ncbi:MAG: glutamate-5-semialdehyde dehydrogenase [Clostridiales bacterium]|jgi:glutamate-5-semialdehyde dehydrogenase|nr:glutamate-5-semialdehyde dehydrogenase [Clostridiales bacterium]
MDSLELIGLQAKDASRHAARLSTTEKNRLLNACAAAIEAESDFLVFENKKDMEQMDISKTAFADRLLLTQKRVQGMADGLRDVAALDDPVGEIISMRPQKNGLNVGQKRVPLGVVGIIYEARPNVTADAFALCFKAGNSCILRGGSEALNSNTAIVSVLQEVLRKEGHPIHLVQLITDTSRDIALQFMRLPYLDVLIPRGGAGLITTAVENSTVPVIATGVGNCHIFVDESADLERAVEIVVNAKVQRPGVCNACEKLLVHEAIADFFMPTVGKVLSDNKVEIRGDEWVCASLPGAKPALVADWGTEYLDMIIGVKIVSNVDEAIAHINRYGTGHSDAILTNSYTNSQKFLDEVDSAAVYVNASTRFTDGAEFGLGAEIGISTQKLHARGPMGLNALTSTKYVIYGSGQARA